jgi:hypothetical protein
VTEHDWLTSTGPQAMLAFAQGSARASDRKLRLFTATCCRHIWHLLPDERSRKAVEVTERYADGQRDLVAVRQAGNEAYQAWEAASSIPDDPGEPPDKVLYGSSRLWWQRPDEDDPVALRFLSPHRGIALFHAAYAAFLVTVAAVERVLCDSQEAVWFGTGESQRSAVAEERQVQSHLFRDLIGNPCCPRLSLPPALLDWHDSLIPQMANAIYKERSLPTGHLDVARLAILADALTDAGCTDTDLLDHLRRPGPHVRGCWAVDALTSRG